MNPLFLQFLIDSVHRYPSAGSGFSTGRHRTENKDGIFLILFRYENCAWAPFLVVFIVAAGVGAKHFVDTPTAPATAAQYFSFGATIAGYTMAWATLSSDYTVYFQPRVSRFVRFCGGQHQNLISKVPAGVFSYTRIWVSLFLL
jgi:hypothetical protein